MEHTLSTALISSHIPCLNSQTFTCNTCHWTTLQLLTYHWSFPPAPVVEDIGNVWENQRGQKISRYNVYFNFAWWNYLFMSTFDNQSMSIGCVGKLGHLFGFLRHYLLNLSCLCASECLCVCLLNDICFKHCYLIDVTYKQNKYLFKAKIFLEREFSIFFFITVSSCQLLCNLFNTLLTLQFNQS